MDSRLPIHPAIKPRWRLFLSAFVVATLFVTLGVLFFLRARAIMEDQLKNNLRSTAAAAAMQFDGRTLTGIRRAQDMSSPAFQEAVKRLYALREEVPSIRFAYILRRTAAPNILEFVADADALSSDEALDVNGNGTVDEDEVPGFPGDQYDVSEYPALLGDAFAFPTTDADITYDQWGAIISGYAPIRRSDNGQVVAVLGIDMLARDYLAASFSILSPGTLFLVLIGTVAFVAAFVLLLIRRQMDAMSQMSSERAGLLQLTFHQLGEPLTIFKWSLETIRDRHPSESLDKLMPDHVKNMEAGIERMSEIIDALRGAEQVELRTLPYHPQRSSLSELLSKIAKDEQPFLAHKRQTLEIGCENNLWCMMDPTWITQVIRGILKNAMSYSPDGATITVRASYRRKHVLVQVIDRGAGIPRADMSHLFEKFRRGSNATTQAGTGLSLYTAKGILGIAGGKIWIESREGEGTTVSFTIPSAS